MLEIISTDDEDGHFNTDSIFYNYLPKLSNDYHSDFYDNYLESYPDRIDRINQLFEYTHGKNATQKQLVNDPFCGELFGHCKHPRRHG